MYDKNTHTNTHTNVWKKQAYKCMIKTRIQMCEKKQAYICMIKTGIQMYEKNILIYCSGGQPIAAPREAPQP